MLELATGTHNLTNSGHN